VDDYLELLEEIRPATFICLDSARSNEWEDGASAYDTVADESQTTPAQQTAAREMARLIAARIEQLPEVQRKVLALYYYEDLRLREIAEVFGVTESRICQIHAQAILAVKSFLIKHGLAGA
jgi:RNA polymerase sigma factor FliA